MDRLAKDSIAVWPLAVVDYEASSLEVDSYPIEVGVAAWRSADQPIVTWSSLIQPEREWRVHGHWSRKSQKVHGIRGSELAGAPSAQNVAENLCARLNGIPTVLCDGGPYDIYWNERLFAAASRPCPFRLADWHGMLTTLASDIREAVEKAGQKHRAGEDALGMMLALATAVRSPAIVQSTTEV